MRFSDLLAKLANQDRLTPQELDQLKRYGNETEQRNSFVAGNTTPSGDLKVPQPFGFIYFNKLAVDTASITIPIPSNYNHLMVFGNGRITSAAYYERVGGRFNGDAGANYTYQNLQSVTTFPASAAFINDTSVSFGTFAAASASADARGSFWTTVTDVQGDAWKGLLSLRGLRYIDATNPVGGYIAGHWQSNSKVQSMTLLPDTGSFVAGSIFSVYGLL